MVKHDDFCPCTRFRAQPEFCRCGAVAREEIVSETIQSFKERLATINAERRAAAIVAKHEGKKG